ncbi:MAG: heat-inducible transcription repressor HrcA [Candidatus Cloacimonetes bacterium]|nr:heat-inducible transcription repressor HrcA [Candidatus Cloacimonadota bacterium]
MKKTKIRLDKTLTSLVDEYIACVEPVSSRILNEKYLTEVSSATLRLDLIKLEKMGYIEQPYTSAGRTPTIKGYREYLSLIEPQHERVSYEGMNLLRELLMANYRDTPRALHFIMQLLARETDQLSFVAEPEVSGGYLARLEVFPIGNHKYIFVMSLDSGLDKTVIMKFDYTITDAQLRRLVRYLNDELVGQRIYDIANHVLVEMRETMHQDSALISQFLKELHKVFIELSDFFINFDGSISFLEQPEFDSKHSILNFMNLIQRQDKLLNLMRDKAPKSGVQILMGDELNEPHWQEFAIIYGRYEVFGIPGYLGVIAPLRMDYRKLIPLVRDITFTITDTTKQGMMIPK